MNAIEASMLTIQSEMDNLAKVIARLAATLETCLLYTSDAADE